MNTQELLSRYQQGERNFRRADLRGASLVNRDLSDADFSGADLRGANFSRATLRSANFTAAKVGLQQHEKILLTSGLVALAALLGAIAGLVGTLVNLELRTYTGAFEEVIAGWAMVCLLLGFALISVLEGIVSGFSVFMIAFVVAVGVAAFGPIAATIIHPLAFAISSAIALAITIISSVSALTVIAMMVVLAAARAFNLATALGVAAAYLLTFLFSVVTTDIMTSVVPVIPCVMLLSAYLGWRAMHGDNRHRLFRWVSTALIMNWGTRFREADLTYARFTSSQLNNIDLRGAILKQVTWEAEEGGEPPVISTGKPYQRL
ncbi:MAG: pentapeptide repeat-containing protein [Synechococcales cyanobacterium M58_A2018_015]|nr:pentapeptide repeat-containing protein [Synechococcales cyanobacterium M58_A2018_015]